MTASGTMVPDEAIAGCGRPDAGSAGPDSRPHPVSLAVGSTWSARASGPGWRRHPSAHPPPTPLVPLTDGWPGAIVRRLDEDAEGADGPPAREA